ncbi:MAG: hypothetical protein KGZ97_01185 [Bacteroidetes bacterium]|nr:hypothetical protein [Bacteroidota bacterium]
MINFKLRELDKIVPWGAKPELSLNWFGLTEGDLWLKFGCETIYEYSKEAIKDWGRQSSQYNDYQIARFIEDFTELFDKISESIPEEIYNLTKDLKKFQSDAKDWIDLCEKGEDYNSDFNFEEYCKLTSWIYQRTLYSEHLVGGPHLSFFRRNDKVRITWDTEHILENGLSLWTAKNGSYEMDYSDFIDKIKDFGQSFFTEMNKQIELAIAKDWGDVEIDKLRIVEEHKERKEEFLSKLLLPENELVDKTDWADIEQLYNRMTNELK